MSGQKYGSVTGNSAAGGEKPRASIKAEEMKAMSGKLVTPSFYHLRKRHNSNSVLARSYTMNVKLITIVF